MRAIPAVLLLFVLTTGCKPSLDDLEAQAGAAALVGDWETALPLFDQLVERVPNDPDHHAQRGRALEAHGDLPGALESYERACRLAPDRADLIVTKGVALLRNGETDRAAADLRVAVRLAPGDDYARGWLAAALARMDSTERNLEAETLAAEILARSERNLGAILAQATLRFRQGLLGPARELTARARAEAPRDPLVAELVARMASGR